MQVIFDGHPYLFVNERYAGKYLPPSNSQWFNYGGDKLWVLPEGNDDEQHWVGNSDVLDDAPFEFQVRSQGQHCEVILSGPADPQTGLQFTRTVSLNADSTSIKFHAVVKNASGHPIEWSVQSVSQYDTADAKRSRPPQQKFLGLYQGEPGEQLPESVSRQIWPGGEYRGAGSAEWIIRGALPAAGGGVVDRFERRLAGRDRWRYPLRDGPAISLRRNETVSGKGLGHILDQWRGIASAPGRHHHVWRFSRRPAGDLYGGGLNSPMVRLEPGEEFNFDTAWYPTRADAKFEGVTDAGVVLSRFARPQAASNEVMLSGSFGVFFSGKLVAHLYDQRGVAAGTQALDAVSPSKLVTLHAKINAVGRTGRVSVHVVDASGVDRGALGEVSVESVDKDE